MKINNKSALTSIFILITSSAINPIRAETPAGQDEVRIHTGIPKRSGESIISASARWKSDEGFLSSSTKLIIINGSDRRHPDNGLSTARKILRAMNSGMIDHHPNMRGLNIKLVENDEDPQIVIKNEKGHTFTQLTLRDYTNQKFSAEFGGTSSSGKSVQIAIDLVDASGINFIRNFNPNTGAQQIFRASGGGIKIRKGRNKPQTVATANRTLTEIERALANAVGGTFSQFPLFADENERDKRNIKPFDGGEVQWADQAVTIDINDESLGVITKYQFSDTKDSFGDGSSNLPLIIVSVLLIAGGLYYFAAFRKENFDTR